MYPGFVILKVKVFVSNDVKTLVDYIQKNKFKLVDALLIKLKGILYLVTLVTVTLDPNHSAEKAAKPVVSC